MTELGISFDVYGRAPRATYTAAPPPTFPPPVTTGIHRTDLRTALRRRGRSVPGRPIRNRHLSALRNEQAYGDQCEACGTITLNATDLIDPELGLTPATPVSGVRPSHWYLPLDK